MAIRKTLSDSAGGLWQPVYNFAQRLPNLYAALITIVALLGYALLLLFPALTIFGAFMLGDMNIQELSSESLFLPIFWAATTTVSAIVSVQLSRLRFMHAEGMAIDPLMADKLHLLLSKLDAQFSVPHINRIVMAEQLSIDVVKTPRFPLPLWSENTLVIGLPLMQCLSPEYFECAVVRKLLQYSKQRHALIKWLHQLRHTWQLYLHHFINEPSFGNFILAGIFRIYTPFYRKLAVPVAHRVELKADQDSLDIVNDEDLLQTIEKVIVTKIYLDKQFWPKVARQLQNESYQYIEPYSTLEDMLKIGLSNKNAKRWLESVYAHESRQLQAIPSLRARMNNIGRSRIRLPEQVTVTAAHYYLDRDYASVVSAINQLWLQRQQQSRPHHTTEVPGNLPNPGNRPTHLPSSLGVDVFH